MSDLEVPEAAIEKAAIRVAGMFAGDEGQWRGYWNFGRAALETAAPLIVAAALVQLADEVEGQPVELVDLQPPGLQYNAGKGYVAGLLRRRARELRGETADLLPCGHRADYVENDEVTADEHQRCGASVLRGEGDQDG